jgi:hypothetical protein
MYTYTQMDVWAMGTHTHTHIPTYTSAYILKSIVRAMGTVMWEPKLPWKNVKGKMHKKLMQLVAKEGKRLSVPNVKGKLHKKLIQLVAKEGKCLSVPPEGVIPDCVYVCVCMCMHTHRLLVSAWRRLHAALLLFAVCVCIHIHIHTQKERVSKNT